MTSYETYARLYRKRSLVVVKDNCVAVVCEGKILLVLFNIPVKKKEKKARKKSEIDTNNVAELEEKEHKTSSSSALSVRDSILKAVDMTKSLPLSDGTDNKFPYFVQREFIITGSGDVVPKDRPFSQNIMNNDEFYGLRKNHCKFAKTMKARQSVSTNEYTAFIWNDGRSITVFYYNVNGKEKVEKAMENGDQK